MDCILCYLDLAKDDFELFVKDLADFTVKAEWPLSYYEIPSFGGTDCTVRIWPSGKAVCCASASKSNAENCIREFRKRIVSSTSSQASIIAWGKLEVGRAEIPLKNVEVYKSVAKAEIQEILDTVQRVDVEYRGIATDAAADALADLETVELVRRARLDNETAEVKSIIVDLAAKERILAKLQVALQRAKSTYKERPRSLRRIRHFLNRVHVPGTAKALVISIVASAIFQYVIVTLVNKFLIGHYEGGGQPLLEESIHKLSHRMPELAYVATIGTATLSDVAAATHKSMGETLVTLNWLCGKGIVEELDRGSELEFRLAKDIDSTYRVNVANNVSLGPIEEVPLQRFGSVIQRVLD